MVADNLEDELLARLRAAEILCDEIEGETLGLSRFVTDRTREDAALIADDALEPASEDRVIRKNADLLEFRGYNVYLDGVRINDQIVEDNEFVDRNPQIEGEHIYNVTAIFDKGEAGLSNDYSFNLSGVNTLAADGMAVKAGRNCIIVTNAGGKEVTISAVNGMVTFRQNIGDYARISLDPGIYMLRAGDRIVKIVVR